MFKEGTRCRICGNNQLVPILDLGRQTLTGVFPRDPRQPITAGPLELLKCTGEDACGLVQLRHSYDTGEMYGENYGYRSSLNRSMVDHLKTKVAGLSSIVPLRSGDLVLDIGSNDGTLLSNYPDTVVRAGMDPTGEKFRRLYPPGAQLIPDFFSADAFRERFGPRKAKIITSIAMFYDLERPVEFVEQIAAVLADDGIWHFEQSYLPFMLSANAYDTVCHEHLEYYGLHQIKWMTDRCGLKILDVELNDINGGSFAVTAAHAASSFQPNTVAVERILEDERRAGLDGMEPYEAFRRRVFEHRDRLRATVDGMRGKGTSILGYGASTKGNVILQFCGFTKDQIPYIAEVNPDKFGAFTPGTGIPIISEADAHAMRPDCLLVLPWHFRTNLIQREASYLKRGGKMLFPLPELQIVP